MRSPAIVFAAFAVFALSGCAHVRTSGDKVGAKGIPEVTKDGKTAAIVMTSQGDIYVRGMKLQNSKFDYPVTVNSRVEYWLDYFTGRGRKHFSKYLERSEFFVPYIVPLLKQNGMPEDLVYLAMIESGFNNHARSRAKAVGPWQFISATGKRYGLMVNWWVDERRDTRKSTLSAVEYLKDLHEMFRSWELAAAAYNAGEAKIARAIRRYGTKDFWALARHRFLRPETRDYVPKIIAAAIISKNRTQFGFPAEPLKPGAGEAVAGDGEVVKVIKDTDPQANSPATSKDAAAESLETVSSILKEDDYDPYEDAPEDMTPAILTVPAESPPAGETLVKNDESQPLAKPVPMPLVSKKGELSGEELTDFEVQSPADLLTVARAGGLSYSTIKSLNPELLRWCTPPTVASYRIKLPSSVKEKFLATYNSSAFPRKVQFLTYRVRQGETLGRIAKHFGIKVDPIADLNGISPRVPLRKGVHVLLPMPSDRSRSLASLEVRDPPERRIRRHRRYNSGKAYKVSFKKRSAARAQTLGDET